VLLGRKNVGCAETLPRPPDGSNARMAILLDVSRNGVREPARVELCLNIANSRPDRAGRQGVEIASSMMFLFVALRLLLVGQQTECPRQRHSRCLRSSWLTSAWQRPVSAPECQLVVRLIAMIHHRIFRLLLILSLLVGPEFPRSCLQFKASCQINTHVRLVKVDGFAVER
jgi:hypothetical protein